jgi:hypothetical protein
MDVDKDDEEDAGGVVVVASPDANVNDCFLRLAPFVMLVEGAIELNVEEAEEEEEEEEDEMEEKEVLM